MTVTAAAFERANRAVVSFAGNTPGGTTAGFAGSVSGLGTASGTASAQLKFTDAAGLTNALYGGTGTADTTTIKIIPFAVGTGTPGTVGDLFVTYDATLGVRPLRFLNTPTGNEYSTAITPGPGANNAGTDNVLLYNQPGVAANFSPNPGDVTAINALAVRGTTTYAGLSGTLQLRSGALISNTTNAAGTAAVGATIPAGLTLDFNGREAVVSNAANLTAAGPLTGYTAFTKAGVGSLILPTPADPNAPPTTNLSGVPLTVNGGLVSFADAARVNGVTGVTLNAPASPFGGSAGGAGLEYTGPGFATLTPDIVTTTGTPRLRSTAGSQLNVTGQVTGAGGLNIAGGTVSLTNSNSYTGQTYVSAGNPGDHPRQQPRRPDRQRRRRPERRHHPPGVVQLRQTGHGPHQPPGQPARGGHPRRAVQHHRGVQQRRRCQRLHQSRRRDRLPDPAE